MDSSHQYRACPDRVLRVRDQFCMCFAKAVECRISLTSYNNLQHCIQIKTLGQGRSLGQLHHSEYERLSVLDSDTAQI
jgi:hypothetical protein